MSSSYGGRRGQKSSGRRADAQPPVERRIDSQLMPAKRRAVAVIDDSLGILGAMKRLLSALGYDSELYASAEEFLDARMITEAFCLIVDIHIGESCGIELAQLLGPVGCRIPIIFMSASSNELIQRRAHEIGCVAFLTKPFTADVVIDALASIPAPAPLEFPGA
jgi:FixJ family two-component response regulator